MFPNTYFPSTYYPDSYFPPASAIITDVVEKKGPFTRYRDYDPLIQQDDEEVLMLLKVIVEVITPRY